MNLINADELLKALKDDKVLDDVPIHVVATVDQYIDCAPNVDAEPVVHAHWESVPNKVLEHGEIEIRGTAEWCSACKHADKDFKKWFEHCPNCGAIMDEHTAEAALKEMET